MSTFKEGRGQEVVGVTKTEPVAEVDEREKEKELDN